MIFINMTLACTFMEFPQIDIFSVGIMFALSQVIIMHVYMITYMINKNESKSRMGQIIFTNVIEYVRYWCKHVFVATINSYFIVSLLCLFVGEHAKWFNI